MSIPSGYTTMFTHTGNQTGPYSVFWVAAQVCVKDTGSGYDVYLRRFISVSGGTNGFQGTTVTTAWGTTVALYNTGNYGVYDIHWTTADYGAKLTLSANDFWASYSNSSTTYTSQGSTITWTLPSPTYTITYNANGGSGAPSSQTYTYASSGSTTLSSTVPTKTGYAFLGWSLSSTATSASYSAGQAWSLSNKGNYTLYAVWSANSYIYDVIHKSSSGLQLKSEQIEGNFGDFLYLYPSDFEGYNNPFPQKIDWDSEYKLITFVYTPISYSITIDCNEGTGVNSISYNVESTTFTLDTPTRVGYNFFGWTGSNGTTPQTTVTINQGSTGNRTYTANWQIITYTLIYDANGGTNAPDSATLVYDEPILIPSEKPTRIGYFFVSWNTVQDGSGDEYYPEDIFLYNGNITLYAQWQPANVAYANINGNHILCYAYAKLDESWKPSLVYGKKNDIYMRSVIGK